MPKILVVEDDALVRGLAVELLSELGLTSVEAGSAAEAKSKLTPGIDALVIDIGLPDQPGDDVARSIRQTHPRLPIIIASGRNEAELSHKFSDDAGIVVIGKPYTLQILDRALTSLGIAAADPAKNPSRRGG